MEPEKRTKKQELKSGLENEKIKIRKVPIETIVPNDWNANEMTDEKEELLRDNIERHDMTSPILVIRHKDELNPDIRYMIIDGEHRWRAARNVGAESIPVVIVKMNEVDAKKQTIRMNNIRGELNFKKFQKLVDDMLVKGQVTMDEAAFEFGFQDDEEFQLVLESARETLPSPEAKREFDKRSKQAKTVDEIYSLVMVLMRKYGETLPANWMIVSMGKARNLWVKMDPRNLRKFENAARDCIEAGVMFDSFLVEALSDIDAKAFIEEHRKALIPIDDHIEEVEDFYEDSTEDLQEAFNSVR